MGFGVDALGPAGQDGDACPAELGSELAGESAGWARCVPGAHDRHGRTSRKLAMQVEPLGGLAEIKQPGGHCGAGEFAPVGRTHEACSAQLATRLSTT
jgi:hypothetical protein